MKKTTMRALSLPVLGAAAVGAYSLLGAPAASAATTGVPGGGASSTVSSAVSGVSGTASKTASSLGASAARTGSAVTGAAGTGPAAPGSAAKTGSAAQSAASSVSGAESAASGAASGASAPARAASRPASAPVSSATRPVSDSTRAASHPAAGHPSAAGLSSQPQVLHNAALGSSYFLDHLQYEHLDQPYAGFAPAIENPGGWTTDHLLPVAFNTESLTLTGNYATSMMDESTSPGGPGAQPPQVLHNAALGSSYFLDHLQYEHLDQQYLGFGPAISDPAAWFTGHLIPVAVNTESLTLTGNSADGGM